MASKAGKPLRRRPDRTTKPEVVPVEDPDTLSHDKLVAEYERLARDHGRLAAGAGKLGSVFSMARRQSRDRFKQKQLAEETDNLTGLPNYVRLLGISGVRDGERPRVSPDGGLYRMIAASLRSKKPISMIFIDLNNFKAVNDNIGHNSADMLVKQFASTLTDISRAGDDLVVRRSGDEFIVAMSGADADVAVKLVQRLSRRLDETGFFTDELKELGFGVSIGIASRPEFDRMHYVGLNPTPKDLSEYWRKVGEELIANSEAAMYKAKEYAKDHGLQLHFNVAGNHPKAVADVAGAVASEMGLSDVIQKVVTDAALFHDLGKVKIPLELLYKEEPLTNSERQLLESHPLMGARLLEEQEGRRRRDPNVPKLFEVDDEHIPSVIEAVRHHHQRWDGQGYPRNQDGVGLKGDEIPVAARILAVADAYAAMTSRNPVRGYNGSPRTRDEAVREIRDKSGIQFDPKVVEAFLSLARKNEV